MNAFEGRGSVRAGQWIKICGLSTTESVLAAVDAGADAIGVVFAPGSPRLVSPARARELREHVRAGVELVGVFRDQDVATMLSIAAEVGLDAVQLHGDEPASMFDAAREHGFAPIRALSAERYLAESPEAAAAFGDVRLLLDAPQPGAGEVLDVARLRERLPQSPWVLAGGLRAENVATLVAQLRPAGVDVSSGVERARGEKDPDLIREFIATVRRIPAA